MLSHLLGCLLTRRFGILPLLITNYVIVRVGWPWPSYFIEWDEIDIIHRFVWWTEWCSEWSFWHLLEVKYVDTSTSCDVLNKSIWSIQLNACEWFLRMDIYDLGWNCYRFCLHGVFYYSTGKSCRRVGLCCVASFQYNCHSFIYY